MRVGKKAKRILKAFLAFVIVCVVIALIYGLFAYKKFYVTEVTVSPENYLPILSDSVAQTLHTKRFYTIPANHILFIPSSYLKKMITQEHQEVSNVVVHYKNLQHIELALTLRKPLFRLENGLAVDTDGVVYEEPTDITALPLFTFSTHFPTKEELANIQDVASRVSVRLGPVTSIEIDPSLDVHYLFDNGVDTNQHAVLTTLKDVPDVLWSTLVSAVDTEPLASLLKNSPHTLEYIDLRFGNKVFYKFGRGGKTTYGTTTATTTGILAEPHR